MSSEQTFDYQIKIEQLVNTDLEKPFDHRSAAHNESSIYTQNADLDQLDLTQPDELPLTILAGDRFKDAEPWSYRQSLGGGSQPTGCFQSIRDHREAFNTGCKMNQQKESRNKQTIQMSYYDTSKHPPATEQQEMVTSYVRTNEVLS